MSFRSRTQNEKKLYEPIKNFLHGVFSKYVEKPKKYVLQSTLSSSEEEKLYLEIVGEKQSYSNKLKDVFDKGTLNIITKEEYFPDIVGYVQKKPKDCPKEVIIVEIKDLPMHLVDVAQAKFYEDIFNPDFTLLISSKGIPPENVNFLLEKETIQGKVIIGQYFENYNEEHKWFKNNKRFEKKTPEIFKKYLA